MVNSKNVKKRSLKNSFERFIRTHDKLVAVFCGIVTGLVNGLFGGGGGMIVVPMLNRLLGFNAKESHATAILVILPLSITSGLIYLSFGALEWSFALSVTAGVIGGGILGALLLKKLSCKWLTLIFSIVMAVAGVKMLIF